jgi:hypothetical protein
LTFYASVPSHCFGNLTSSSLWPTTSLTPYSKDYVLGLLCIRDRLYVPRIIYAGSTDCISNSGRTRRRLMEYLFRWCDNVPQGSQPPALISFIQTHTRLDLFRCFYNLLPRHPVRQTVHPPLLSAHQPRPHLSRPSIFNQHLRDHIHPDINRYRDLRLLARYPLLGFLHSR